MFDPDNFIPVLYMYFAGLTVVFMRYIMEAITAFGKIENIDIKAKLHCSTFIFTCIISIVWMYQACIFTEKVTSLEVLERMFSTPRMNGMILTLVSSNILLVLLGLLRKKHPNIYGFKVIQKKQKNMKTQ